MDRHCASSRRGGAFLAVLWLPLLVGGLIGWESMSSTPNPTFWALAQEESPAHVSPPSGDGEEEGEGPVACIINEGGGGIGDCIIIEGGGGGGGDYNINEGGTGYSDPTPPIPECVSNPSKCARGKIPSNVEAEWFADNDVESSYGENEEEESLAGRERSARNLGAATDGFGSIPIVEGLVRVTETVRGGATLMDSLQGLQDRQPISGQSADKIYSASSSGGPSIVNYVKSAFAANPFVGTAGMNAVRAAQTLQALGIESFDAFSKVIGAPLARQIVNILPGVQFAEISGGGQVPMAPSFVDTTVFDNQVEQYTGKAGLLKYYGENTTTDITFIFENDEHTKQLRELNNELENSGFCHITANIARCADDPKAMCLKAGDALKLVKAKEKEVQWEEHAAKWKECAANTLIPQAVLETLMLPKAHDRFGSIAVWGSKHRSSRNECSTGNPGPSGIFLEKGVLDQGLITNRPVTLLKKSPLDEWWGSSLDGVYKVDSSFQVSSFHQNTEIPNPEELLHSQCSIAVWNRYFVCKGSKLMMYYEDTTNPQSRRIFMEKELSLPQHPTENDEAITGICHVYASDKTGPMTSKIIWVSNKARVGMFDLRRVKDLMNFTTNKSVIIDIGKTKGELLTVETDMACDNKSAYVISDRYLHRISNLNFKLDTPSLWTVFWSAAYARDEGTEQFPGNKPSVPSIVGTGKNQVIAMIDAAAVPNLVIIDSETGVFIEAASITFGEEDPPYISAGRAIVVRGWRLAVVNTTPSTKEQNSNIFALGNFSAKFAMKTEIFKQFAAAITNNWPVIVGNAPKGVQQFQYNPYSKRVRTVWINKHVSLCNSVPAMSANTGLLYGIGKRGGVGFGSVAFRGMWTLEALNWWTGDLQFVYNIGLGPWTDALYSSTIIGEGELITTTPQGIVRLRDKHMILNGQQVFRAAKIAAEKEAQIAAGRQAERTAS